MSKAFDEFMGGGTNTAKEDEAKSAQDAQFKVGQYVRSDRNSMNKGVVTRVFTNGGRDFVEYKMWDSGKLITEPASALVSYDAAEDAAEESAQDAELAVGAKVQVVKGSLSGGNGVVKSVNGDVYRVAMSYGGEYGFRADQLKAYDADEGACVTNDADKSEELEREIKGDVVAVVSGNAARVSHDVSFEAAKAGVESFARKNGVSVVSSQDYGDAYKFKFSAAVDAATDADEKIHYELKGLVKTLRAKGLPQDEISRKLTTYCRENDIPLSYLNRSIFDGCEAAQDAALKFRVGQTVVVNKKSFPYPSEARIVGYHDMRENDPNSNEQGYVVKYLQGGGEDTVPEHCISLA